MPPRIAPLIYVALALVAALAAILLAQTHPQFYLLGLGEADPRHLLPLAVAGPAAIVGAAVGPRARGSALVVALLAGALWYPVAWLVLWLRVGSDVPFGAFLESAIANIEVVTKSKVLGATIATKVAAADTGLLTKEWFVVATIATLVSFAPWLRKGGCPACDRTWQRRTLGFVSWTRRVNGNDEADSAAALQNWVAAPTPALPQPAANTDSCLHVFCDLCPACGRGVAHAVGRYGDPPLFVKDVAPVTLTPESDAACLAVMSGR